jgi:hypothetical protein
MKPYKFEDIYIHTYYRLHLNLWNHYIYFRLCLYRSIHRVTRITEIVAWCCFIITCELDNAIILRGFLHTFFNFFANSVGFWCFVPRTNGLFHRIQNTTWVCGDWFYRFVQYIQLDRNMDSIKRSILANSSSLCSVVPRRPSWPRLRLKSHIKTHFSPKTMWNPSCTWAESPSWLR